MKLAIMYIYIFTYVITGIIMEHFEVKGPTIYGSIGYIFGMGHIILEMRLYK